MHCWLAGSQFTLQSRKSNFIRFEYYYVNKQEGFSCPYTRRIAARLQNCCCCCFTTPRRHTHRPSSSRRVAWWSLHRNKLLAGENEKLLSSPGTKDKLSSVGSCLPTLVHGGGISLTATFGYVGLRRNRNCELCCDGWDADTSSAHVCPRKLLCIDGLPLT